MTAGVINIGGNQLTSLPETIGNFKNLTYLNISSNQLTSLPETIVNLENLEYLDIGNNQLTSLPETIGNLENLTRLNIQDNQLTSLPESIINLTKLYLIWLSDNELNNYSDKVKDFLIQLINSGVLDDWQPEDFVEQQPTDNIIESYIHNVPNEVKETVNLDDVDCSELEQEIIDRLDQIIVDNTTYFRQEGDFKVRPGYGYDKFYLDWVYGSYDMSLQSLIHYIMYEDGIYKKILNKNQYARLLHVVNEQPESIFGADESIDENYSQLQYDFLDYFYYTPIKFVYDKLTSLGFDVSDAFCEYLGIDPDDEDYHEDYDDYESEANEEYESEADDDSSDIANDSVEITEPALIIRINLEDSDNITAQELYNATRSAWKINLARANNVEYVLSVHQGIVKEVYQVSGWYDAGATFVPKREDIIGSGRYEFVGTVAEDTIRDKYLNKSVKHLFKKENAQPVMYFNC